MCQVKSAIVLKDRVYMPHKHDHHTQMLEELGIKDDTQFPNFVRVEITPNDGDLFNHDMDNWKLNVDQDFRPDWFDVEKAEKECKIKLQEWFDKCFVINNKEWTEHKDTKILVKNSKVKTYNSSVEAWDNSSVVAWENSSVVAWENSSVVARDNSSVVAWDNSSVVARDNSSVVARDNSSVVARGNSSVEAWDNSQILIPKSIWYKDVKIKGIHDNATVKDLHAEPKIYVANDFEIVKFKND